MKYAFLTDTAHLCLHFDAGHVCDDEGKQMKKLFHSTLYPIVCVLFALYSSTGELYHSRPNYYHRGRYVLANFGVE